MWWPQTKRGQINCGENVSSRAAMRLSDNPRHFVPACVATFFKGTCMCVWRRGGGFINIHCTDIQTNQTTGNSSVFLSIMGNSTQTVFPQTREISAASPARLQRGPQAREERLHVLVEGKRATEGVCVCVWMCVGFCIYAGQMCSLYKKEKKTGFTCNIKTNEMFPTL